VSNFNDVAYFIPAVIARSTEVPVDLIDRLLRRYSGIIESMYPFTLNGELALWRQKWSSLLSDRPDGAIPETAAEGFAACDQQAFPLIHTFLAILFTFPVSTVRSIKSTGASVDRALTAGMKYARSLKFDIVSSLKRLCMSVNDCIQWQVNGASV